MAPAVLASQQPMRAAMSMRGRTARMAQTRPCPLGLCSARSSKPLLAARRQEKQQFEQIGEQQVAVGAAADGFAASPTGFSGTPDSDTSSLRLPDAARRSLSRATTALKRYGWLGFWSQLAVSIISGVILLFSVAFTSSGGPKLSLYLTLVGILLGFLSTFWNFSYLRTANKMQEYLDGADVAKVKKQQVVDMLTRGVMINVAGLGATLLGIQTMVGMLVAKTLSNASISPFAAAGLPGYNPVLALDVFLVQAATNTLLGHFLSMLFSLWLLNVVGEGRGLRFQQGMRLQELKSKERSGDEQLKTLSGAIVNQQVMRQTTDSDDQWPFGGGGSAGGGKRKRNVAASAVPATPRNLPAVTPSGMAGSSLAVAALPLSSSEMLSTMEETRSTLAAAAEKAALFTSTTAEVTTTAVRQLRDKGPLGLSGVGNAFSLARYRAGLMPRPTGGLPGDMGFDPLRLYNPSNKGGLLDPKWLQYSEVIHGRWAMLAAAGCLAPEVLHTGVEWFRTGWLPVAGHLPWVTDYSKLFALQMTLMAGAELARISDYTKPGSAAQRLVKLGASPDAAAAFAANPRQPAYPGGPVFNPLRIVNSRPAMEEFKTAEIKHGRLAMLAMLGFSAQALVTGVGPWRNLLDHLQSPFVHNIFESITHPVSMLSAGAAAVAGAAAAGSAISNAGLTAIGMA